MQGKTHRSLVHSDIMGYFNGSPGQSTKGRLDQAEAIARQGRLFTQERWRKEDMQSYLFLLLLEVRGFSSFD
jgi:beta-1,2-xylosyltransferase